VNSPSHILAKFFTTIILLVLIFSVQTAFAQKPDSITHHYDSLSKIKIWQLDSSNNGFNNKLDSAQLRLNNILNPNFNKLSSKFRTKKLEQSDTLRATHELDSMKRGLSHKIDSLKGLNLPTERYTRKLDSLNNISPQKYIDMANAKVKSVEDKINKPVDQLESKINQPAQQLEDKINKPVTNVENKINDKLNVMRQEGGDGANLPGNINTKDLSLDKNGLPANPLKESGNPLGDVNPLGNTNSPLDKANNPLSKIDNPVTDQAGQLNELKDKVTDIKSTPTQQIDKLKSIDEIQTAKEKVGDLNNATDKVQSYQGEIKKVASGDLNEVKEIPGAIEKKAGSLDEIKDLQKQTGEIDKAKGELDKIKAMGDKANDPEAMKQMAKQEITKQAVDHFKGKEQVLQQAMDKVSKLKQKYPELQSLKDIPKRPPNPMKNKPLIERIVPGLTLQLQKSHNVMIDLNPVVSYRFTGRINAGFGWNERLSFNKWNKLSSFDRIYGPRVFGSFAFKKGFSVKAEVEKMNTLIPSSPTATDGTRQWVWSAFVGLKKDYKFIGKVRGNVQILYNLYDDHYNSPYFDRLNVRMGFEFPMKKARKVAENGAK
jgi:hypothetical protein